MRLATKFLALWLLAWALKAPAQSTPTVRFSTVAEMLSFAPSTSSAKLSALVTGRSNANDGGGGLFFYDSSSVVSTNLGTVFKPASTSGRWLRQYGGPLNVRWFGALGDGTTDDTAAFTNALSVAASTTNGVVEIPYSSSTYQISSITIPSNSLTLRGYQAQYNSGSAEIPRAYLRANTVGATMISVPVTLFGIRIENLLLDGDNKAVTGLSASQNIIVERVTARNCTSQGILGQQLNGAVFTEVSGWSNRGNGMSVTPSATISTVYALNSCVFRENGTNGFFLQEGTRVSFNSCVFESNTGNGLNILKPASGALTGFSFYDCWFENNGAAAVDDTRYQVIIDSVTHDFGDGPPAFLSFSNCNFGANNATQRGTMVRSVRFCDFYFCGWGGGTAANNIQLDTWASYVVFHDRNGGPTSLSGGNRCFDFNKGTAGPTGGYESTGYFLSPLFLGGSTASSQLELRSTFGAGTTDSIKMSVGNNGGTTALTIANSGAVTAAVSFTDNALTSGRVTFAGASGLLSDDADLTFATDTLTATKVIAPTSVTSPLILGGTSTTSDLSLQTTSGVGASGADMHFLVGNNGATEAVTILNSADVGFGTTAPNLGGWTKALTASATTAGSKVAYEMQGYRNGASQNIGGFDIWNSTTNVAAVYFQTEADPSAVQIAFYTKASGGSISSKMFLTGAGGLGLGMTPTTQLELSTDSAQKPTTALWTITSDVRAKDNIVPYTKGLADLLQINLHEFTFNGFGNTVAGQRGVGVIADEIETILPETVTISHLPAVEASEAKIIDGKEVPAVEAREAQDVKTFNGHELLFGVMPNAIKELAALVAAQRQEIDDLKARVAQLEAK